jgi:hypothetical protein
MRLCHRRLKIVPLHEIISIREKIDNCGLTKIPMATSHLASAIGGSKSLPSSTLLQFGYISEIANLQGSLKPDAIWRLPSGAPCRSLLFGLLIFGNIEIAHLQRSLKQDAIWPLLLGNPKSFPPIGFMQFGQSGIVNSQKVPETACDLASAPKAPKLLPSIAPMQFGNISSSAKLQSSIQQDVVLPLPLGAPNPSIL